MGAAVERLIAFRLTVASTSDWPPERNTMPGTVGGNTVAEDAERRLRDPLRARLVGVALPGMTMFGFSSEPPRSTRWRVECS